MNATYEKYRKARMAYQNKRYRKKRKTLLEYQKRYSHKKKEIQDELVFQYFDVHGSSKVSDDVYSFCNWLLQNHYTQRDVGYFVSALRKLVLSEDELSLLKPLCKK